MKKNRLGLAILASFMTMAVASCNHNDDTANTNDDGGNNASRFSSAKAPVVNGGGEILIDTTTNLTWMNDTALDSNSDGCVSPANVGPTEPEQANSRCDAQTFGGFNDWRAPTTSELTALITSAVETGTTMKYLNPNCPALVASNGIVRTENANDALAGTPAGGVIGMSLADLNGAGAGVRCVRDGINQPVTEPRFTVAKATAANGGGRTLVDTQNNLEWINQAALDSRQDGCISPGAVGPIRPDSDSGSNVLTANERCSTQNYAGHNDWRAPTADELATVIRDVDTADGIALRYLVAACPANVSTSNIVRTENANPNASAAFPNAQTGDELGKTLQSVLDAVTAGGGGAVGSGVRCVRDITP